MSGEPPPETRSQRRWLAAAAAAAWLCLSGWSLARGSRELAHGLRAQPRVPFTRTASTDALLESTPGLTSDSFRRAIAEVPEEGAVLFVGVRGSSTFFPRLYTFSLLALPREMPAVACAPGQGDGRGGVIVPFDAEARIMAVIFDGVRPDAATARPIAPGVWWQRLATPVPATSQWTLVCPSSPPPSF